MDHQLIINVVIICHTSLFAIECLYALLYRDPQILWIVQSLTWISLENIFSMVFGGFAGSLIWGWNMKTIQLIINVVIICHTSLTAIECLYALLYQDFVAFTYIYPRRFIHSKVNLSFMDVWSLSSVTTWFIPIFSCNTNL